MTTETMNCLEACQKCSIDCERCLHEMIDMESDNDCPHCCRECLDICTLCAHAIARESKYTPQICKLCADICEWCASQCGEHDHDHCQRCAESCRACADACRAMAA